MALFELSAKSEYYTDFTGSDLYRVICAWVYDPAKMETGTRACTGEGEITDSSAEDRPEFSLYTDVNATTQISLKLVYGEQEESWCDMLSAVATYMRDHGERRLYISLICNARDKCNVRLHFSGNGRQYKSPDQIPAQGVIQGNVTLCADIPHSLDECSQDNPKLVRLRV